MVPLLLFYSILPSLPDDGHPEPRRHRVAIGRQGRGGGHRGSFRAIGTISRK